ncbi:hypothetical protein BH11ARM2_BH11ARM2_07220 [soil metagenome]
MIPVFAACLLAKTAQIDANARLTDLLTALKSPRPLARSNAARAVAELDLTTQWPGEEGFAFEESMRTSPQRREMAAALIEAAKDPNIAVRNEAIRSLVILLRPRQSGIHGPVWDPSLVRPIIELGPRVIPVMVEFLRTTIPRGSPDGPYTAQLAAFEVLSTFKDPRILELLLKRIHHDPLYLITGLMMMGAAEYDDPRVAKILVDRIFEEIADISTGAYTALLKMGDRAIPTLIDAMDHHPNLTIRVEASAFLLSHRTPEVRAAFERLLKDSNEELRERARIILEDWPKTP